MKFQQALEKALGLILEKKRAGKHIEKVWLGDFSELNGERAVKESGHRAYLIDSNGAEFDASSVEELAEKVVVSIMFYDNEENISTEFLLRENWKVCIQTLQIKNYE